MTRRKTPEQIVQDAEMRWHMKFEALAEEYGQACVALDVHEAQGSKADVLDALRYRSEKLAALMDQCGKMPRHETNLRMRARQMLGAFDVWQRDQRDQHRFADLGEAAERLREVLRGIVK